MPSIQATEEGEEVDEVFNERHYERKFFNEETNIAMCKAFIDNGLFDPVAKKVELDFLVSLLSFVFPKNTPRRVTNILNKSLLKNGQNNTVSPIFHSGYFTS